MQETSVDWIYQGPACAVLIVNLIFLIRIMWVSKIATEGQQPSDGIEMIIILFVSLCLHQVLITKLRSANTVETRQYHKAAKALLVLIPLLGVTYLVLLYGPSEGFWKHVFAYSRATLISTQVSREGRGCL